MKFYIRTWWATIQWFLLVSGSYWRRLLGGILRETEISARQKSEKRRIQFFLIQRCTMSRVQRSCQTCLEYPTMSKLWDKWLWKRAILSIESPRQFGAPPVEQHTSKYLYVHMYGLNRPTEVGERVQQQEAAGAVIVELRREGMIPPGARIWRGQALPRETELFEPPKTVRFVWRWGYAHPPPALTLPQSDQTGSLSRCRHRRNEDRKGRLPCCY